MNAPHDASIRSQPRPPTGAGKTIAVIGGGIAGLAAACRARQLAPGATVRLFESSDRLGGVLQTEHRDGYLLEHSADNFITDLPWGLDFSRHVGIGETLLPTTAGDRRAGIVCQGRIEPLPDGFALLAPGKLWPLLTSPLLSLSGKLRLAAEYVVPRRHETSDESFADFARRRIGREAYECIAQPLVSGIYTADPERLSMQAALPRFVAMEKNSGSLIRAARQSQRDARSGKSTNGATDNTGPRYSLFAAPREGMGALIQAAAKMLPADAIRTSGKVACLTPPDESSPHWQFAVRDAQSAATQEMTADAVVLAMPSWSAAELVKGFDRQLASELGAIEYAGCTVALIGCAAEQITRPFEGFGFVVPEIERRPILACSHASAKFPGRAPAGRVLLRVFVGGACHPELNQLADDDLRRLVLQQLGELSGLRGEPELFRVARWSRAMPQYHVGHVERVRRIEAAQERWPSLALAGNAYRGVGVPQCIRSGQAAADMVIAGW